MSQKLGGSSSKFGRNKRFCDAYKSLGIRMKNKRRKVMRHYKRSEGKDKQAYNWLHAQGAL